MAGGLSETLAHALTRTLLTVSGFNASGPTGRTGPAGPPPVQEGSTAPQQQEAWASLAVLTQLVLLGTALVAGRALTAYRIEWLSEAGVALLLGVFTGALARAASISSTYLSWLSFKKEFFFIALLPPIIFEAGFSLEVKPFFRNIGAICTYAFLGTSISTLVIGLSLWVAGLVRMCLRLSLVEALMYGSIISATDPVTVLAVFQRLGADRNLYALVFGESVLNDAVCIVLYRTLTPFRGKPVTGQALWAGFLSFWTTFIGSMAIGVMVGLLASLALKTRLLKSKHTPLESCLCILIAFASYMVADGFQLSGIVSILFCGMVMAHYARPNLTRAARDRTLAFFRILATLSETFVFIYIGASLARPDQAWGSGFTWSLVALLLLGIAGSRAANIAACSRLINYLRPPDLHIPPQHKFMMWWAGLRGAIAFALSLEASEDLGNEGKGRVLLTTSLLIVMITVLVNGGATAHLLEKLNLRVVPGGSSPAASLMGAGSSLALFPRFSDNKEADVAIDRQRLLTDGSLPGDPSLGAGPPLGDHEIEVQDGAPTAPPGGTVPDSGTGDTAEAGAESGSGWPTSGQDLSNAATRFLKNSIAVSVQKVREANRFGLLTQLEAFDTRYLQKLFVRPEQDDVDTPLGPSGGDGHPAPFEGPTSTHVPGEELAPEAAHEAHPNAAVQVGEVPVSSSDASAEVHGGPFPLTARSGSEGAGTGPFDMPSARSGNARGAQGLQQHPDFDPWGLWRGLPEGSSGSARLGSLAGSEGAPERRTSEDGMTRAYSVGNPRRSFTGTSWPALRPGSPLDGIDEGQANIERATSASQGLREELGTAGDLALSSDEGCGGYIIVDSYGHDEEGPEPSGL